MSRAERQNDASSARDDRLFIVGPASAQQADARTRAAEPQRASASVGEEAVLALVAVALAVGLWVGAGAAAQQAREQGAAALQQTVISTAMQCFAIEGAYPQTLEYLEDRYGLSVNHEAYAVTYEAFASNVMPSVAVVPR